MNEHWIADGKSAAQKNARTRLQASPVGLGWALDFAANREVRFLYSDRTDRVANTTDYTQYYLTKKLDRIEEYVGGNLVRAYDLAYSYLTPRWHTQQAPGAQPPYPQVDGLPKLVLSSVTEKDASGTALPATSFSYAQGTMSGSSEYHKLQLATVANGYGAVVTYGYELHTPDGWSKLPRRYRVKSHQTDPGTGSAGGTSSVVSLAYSYGTSYNLATTDKPYDYRGHEWVTVADAAGHYSRSWFYTRDAINGKVPSKWRSSRIGYTPRSGGLTAPPPTAPGRRPTGG